MYSGYVLGYLEPEDGVRVSVLHEFYRAGQCDETEPDDASWKFDIGLGQMAEKV